MDKWGKRRLAYDVKGCREGYYFLLTIEGQSTVVQDLEQRLKIDDQVLRHLTVRVDNEKGRQAAQDMGLGKPSSIPSRDSDDLPDGRGVDNEEQEAESEEEG
jgi:hypothetical protein